MGICSSAVSSKYKYQYVTTGDEKQYKNTLVKIRNSWITTSNPEEMK